jgi:hypothetical protein
MALDPNKAKSPDLDWDPDPNHEFLFRESFIKMNMMKYYVLLKNFGFGCKPCFIFLVISTRKKTYIQEGIQATGEASSTTGKASGFAN